jgi:hypothetical protein
MQLSASSAALDLALSQSPGPDSNGWGAPFSSRGHRSSRSQQSLPMSNLQGQTNGSSSNSQSNGPESPVSVRPSYRHSLDLQYFEGHQDSSSPPVTSPKATPPKIHSSQSASEVPTMRSTMNGMSSVNTTPNSHAQQHLHNHNASLGRIPPNAMNNRLSREMSSGEAASLRDAQNGGYQSINSALQASTAPFNPTLTQGMSQAQMTTAMTSPTTQQAYSVPGYYNYNLPMMTMGMQNMSLGQQQPMYSPPHNPYAPYGNMYPQTQTRSQDSQARVIQQRRQNDGEGKFFCLTTID